MLGDTNRQVRFKFKSVATTVEEQKDTHGPLSADDMLFITVGTRVLEYGRVCVYSKNFKSLNVANDLMQNVMVSVVNDHREIKVKPMDQLVPSGM
jgi:hypothetical protein